MKVRLPGGKRRTKGDEVIGSSASECAGTVVVGITISLWTCRFEEL